MAKLVLALWVAGLRVSKIEVSPSLSFLLMIGNGCTGYPGPEKQNWIRGRRMASSPERRKLARLRLEVLLRILLPGATQAAHAETRNLSARGIFFHTQAQVVPGQNLECVLILPEKLTLASAPMLVGCKGKVVRVNRDLPDETIGVAVEISSYDFPCNGEF